LRPWRIGVVLMGVTGYGLAVVIAMLARG